MTTSKIEEIEKELKALYDRHKMEYREEVEAQGLDWEDENANDPWKGLFNYSNAEYRDAQGSLVAEADAQAREARIWVWREAASREVLSFDPESTRQASSPSRGHLRIR